MKAKINVGFSSTIQAISFHPVTSTDSIEIEIEYTDDKDLEKQIEKYQGIIRAKTIKNVIAGVADVITEQAKAGLTKSKG